MKATDLLRCHHRQIESLFQAIDVHPTHRRRDVTFKKLSTLLIAHDAVERRIFYPACRDRLVARGLLSGCFVAHGLVEFGLAHAEANLATDEFPYLVQVIRDVVEEHVTVEETELLRNVDDNFTAEELEQLGDRLATAFVQARVRAAASP